MKPLQEADAVPAAPTWSSLMLPIYWMLNMSFKTNEEILVDLHACSRSDFTLDNYRTIFTDAVLVLGLHQLA